LLAGVHQQEATSAVRFFLLRRGGSTLAQPVRLLIAQDSGNGHTLDRAVRNRAVTSLLDFPAATASRNFKCAQKFIVPNPASSD